MKKSERYMANACVAFIAALVSATVTVGVLGPPQQALAAPSVPADVTKSSFAGGFPLNVTKPNNGDVIAFVQTANGWKNVAGGSLGTNLAGTQVNNHLSKGNGTDTIQSTGIDVDASDNLNSPAEGRFNSYAGNVAVCGDPTAIDPRDSAIQTLTLSGDTTFGFEATALAVGLGRGVSLFVTCDGSNRALTFDASWVWATDKPASIAANTQALLSLLPSTSAASGILAAWTPITDGTAATLTALIDAEFGSTRGAILYRGASGWAILAPGTNGHPLISQGSGADPAYSSTVEQGSTFFGSSKPLGVGTSPSSPDTFWYRSSAGSWLASGNSTGTSPASIMWAFFVEANTAGSGAPNVLSSIETGRTFTNEGSTAENYHTLPTAAAGLHFRFVVQDVDGLRVVASTGDTIRYISAVTSTAGYVESFTIGTVFDVEAINSTEWIVTNLEGSLTVGP